MAFLRLAGCSVGCPGCDTDYTVGAKLTLPEVIGEIQGVMPEGDRDQWVWVTGGEPGDLTQKRQSDLIAALKAEGWSVAVATSGANPFRPPVDWLSVSPHSSDPAKFQQRYGNEVKLVDGLNGLDPEEWVARWESTTDFWYRYVQPFTEYRLRTFGEEPASLERCLAFLRRHPRWAMSQQRHRQWKLP